MAGEKHFHPYGVDPQSSVPAASTKSTASGAGVQHAGWPGKASSFGIGRLTIPRVVSSRHMHGRTNRPGGARADRLSHRPRGERENVSRKFHSQTPINGSVGFSESPVFVPRPKKFSAGASFTRKELEPR